MTLLDLCTEVNEKTHLGELEVLELVRRNWPGRMEFTPTQCRLVVQLVANRGGVRDGGTSSNAGAVVSGADAVRRETVRFDGNRPHNLSFDRL
jgi:hypothetical protein